MKSTCQNFWRAAQFNASALNADVEFKNAGHVDCLLSGVGNIDLEGTVKSLSKNVRGTGNIDTTELMVHGSRK